MKLRESGMPAEEYWDTLLDPEANFLSGNVTNDSINLMLATLVFF